MGCFRSPPLQSLCPSEFLSALEILDLNAEYEGLPRLLEVMLEGICRKWISCWENPGRGAGELLCPEMDGTRESHQVKRERMVRPNDGAF